MQDVQSCRISNSKIAFRNAVGEGGNFGEMKSKGMVCVQVKENFKEACKF